MIKNVKELNEQFFNIKFKHRKELLYYIDLNDERKKLYIFIAFVEKCDGRLVPSSLLR